MLQPLTFWFVCALLALIAEFLSGTFYLLVVAIAMAGGGLAAMSNSGEIFQFGVASLTGVVGVLLLRQRKRRQPAAPHQASIDDPDLGQTVHILQITSPRHARVHYRGAEWDAELLDDALQAGAEGYIAGRNGNSLKITSTQPE